MGNRVIKRGTAVLALGIAVMCFVGCGSQTTIDEATQMVIDEIDSIGEVTIDDEAIINKAYERYNSLPDSQKELVSNYATLLKAIDELELIKSEQADNSEDTIENTQETEPVKKPSEKSYEDVTIDDVTYSYAKFDEYNSPAEENGHGDEKVFSYGKLDSINTDYDVVMANLTTEGGDIWATVFLEPANTRMSTIDKLCAADEVKVCGTYPGFSEKLKRPCLYPDVILIDEEVFPMTTWTKGAWTETTLSKDKTLYELSYKEPGAWSNKTATSPEGMYYYPYDDSVWGIVYISCQDLPSGATSTKAFYDEVLSGIVKSDEDILSKESVKIGSSDAYKANIMSTVNEPEDYETIVYLVNGNEKMYSIMFSDYYELSSEMKQFADDFMKTVTIKGTDSKTEAKEDNKESKTTVKEEKKETTKTEANNNSTTTQESKSSTGYQSILDEYTKKIKDAAPGLVAEYKSEAAGISDMTTLATLCNDKVSKLAEISTDGISKMATYMYKTGGSYDEYETWSGKLMDVYMNEAEKIQNAYMASFGL